MARNYPIDRSERPGDSGAIQWKWAILFILSPFIIILGCLVLMAIPLPGYMILKNKFPDDYNKDIGFPHFIVSLAIYALIAGLAWLAVAWRRRQATHSAIAAVCPEYRNDVAALHLRIRKLRGLESRLSSAIRRAGGSTDSDRSHKELTDKIEALVFLQDSINSAKAMIVINTAKIKVLGDESTVAEEEELIQQSKKLLGLLSQARTESTPSGKTKHQAKSFGPLSDL